LDSDSEFSFQKRQKNDAMGFSSNKTNRLRLIKNDGTRVKFENKKLETELNFTRATENLADKSVDRTANEFDVSIIQQEAE
jgi:transcriptional regulator NrdR family protein